MGRVTIKMTMAVWLLLTTGACLGQGFTGSFAANFEGVAIRLELRQHKDGSVKGTLSGDEAGSVSGYVRGGVLTGTFTADGEQVPFRATLEGSELRIQVKQETLTLLRSGSPARSKSNVKSAKSAAPRGNIGTSNGQAVPESGVWINGVRLSVSQLDAITRRYGLRIPPGKYWYDRACGAWGVEGGPTLGVTIAGVQLGGRLRADASRGNTGVFVNGRQLPQRDVAVLQQMRVPVMQGYWQVDSQGDVRQAGRSQVLCNLFQFSRSQGRGSGWYHAGAAGYSGSDGQTMYFFDPKGGSVIIGP